MLPEESKFQALCGHYSETFDHIQSYLRLRDRLLVYILLVVAAMLFQISYPSDAGATITELIKRKMDITTTINISFVGSILWFSLLALLVRYYQAVVYLDRQHTYIHGLEKELSSVFDERAFTRAGKSYLTGYPLFSSWSYVLYTVIIPVILLIVVVARLVFDFKTLPMTSLLLWVNVVMAVCICISTVLYVVWLHFKK